MTMKRMHSVLMAMLVTFSMLPSMAAEEVRELPAQTPKDTGLCDRIRCSLDAVPAIDTHDHLLPRA